MLKKICALFCSAVMGLTAIFSAPLTAAANETDGVLSPGCCENLTLSGGSTSGTADTTGKYYYLSDTLQVTALSEIYNYGSDTVFSGGYGFKYAFTFKNYQKNILGSYTKNPNPDSEEDDPNIYIQYSVLPETVINVPMISINYNRTDANNFDKFRFLVSADGESFTELDSSALTYDVTAFDISGLDYGMREYKITIPNGFNYLRMVWPKSYNTTPLWGVDRLSQGLFMLPAYCDGEPEILGSGKYDSLSSDSRSDSGYAKPTGRYYRLNGLFNITEFASVDTMSYLKVLSVDGIDYSHAFAPADSTGVCEASDVYVEYRPEKGSTVKIPIIAERDNTMSHYDSFAFKGSSDGSTYYEIPSENVYYTDNVNSYVINFNIRLYTVKLPEDCSVLRIYWPNYADIVANSYWDGSRASQSAVMMLPVKCEAELTPLTPGTDGVLDASAEDFNGISLTQGTNYELGGNFNITDFSASDVLNYTEEITVDGRAYSYAFAPANNTGLVADTANTYIQYSVEQSTVVKVPIIVEAVNSLSNYGEFKFLMSTDGVEFTQTTHVTYKDTEFKGTIPFNIRVYTFVIPENAAYLRIVWPEYSYIKAHSYWSGSRADSTAVMMLPLYCDSEYDVNSDGYTDITDLVRLKKYTVGTSSVYAPKLLDYNSDGSVSAADLVILRKRLLNGEEKTEAVKASPNEGLDFGFDGSISYEVLCNYLSRSMVIENAAAEKSLAASSLKLIKNTGAKYISRAGCYWNPSVNEENSYANTKSFIEKAHSYDSELLFEACFFENITESVNEITIPDWVFEAFGKDPESRSFNYESFLFDSDGSHSNYIDYWGTGASVPDITKDETQMLLYYRACMYIDQGYEVLHLGQVHLIGAEDENYACYTKVLDMIRAYAKAHARRHFILINAHTYGITDANGKLMCDFHAYPMRAVVPSGSVSHYPTEDNPQDLVFEVGKRGAIYGKSLGGETYSGWVCDSLPYIVELDNYQTDIAKNKNSAGAENWGYDEISWFANQPASFRKKWLNYAYNQVRQLDSAGYFQMPGRRACSLYNGDLLTGCRKYSALDRARNNTGFGDETAIYNIWLSNLKNRD